jgi:hypothetical protein
MIVYSRTLLDRLTSWAEAVPQAIYGEAAARITELERENADLRNRLYSLTFEMRAVGQSLIGLADTYATIPNEQSDALKEGA